MKKDVDFRAKITLCGDYAVGKTSVCRRFSGKSFKKSYKPTVGVDIHTKSIKVGGLRVELQIWDMAGQSRFESVLPQYFEGSKGTLIVFDLTRRESFKSIPKWLKKVRNKADRPSAVLIGNKSDLETLRSIDKTEAEEILDEFSLYDYIETSAKEGDNIHEAFRTLVEAILRKARGKGKRI